MRVEESSTRGFVLLQAADMGGVGQHIDVGVHRGQGVLHGGGVGEDAQALAVRLVHDHRQGVAFGAARGCKHEGLDGIETFLFGRADRRAALLVRNGRGRGLRAVRGPRRIRAGEIRERPARRGGGPRHGPG